jgi:hypothetical protein
MPINVGLGDPSTFRIAMHAFFKRCARARVSCMGESSIFTTVRLPATIGRQGPNFAPTRT